MCSVVRNLEITDKQCWTKTVEIYQQIFINKLLMIKSLQFTSHIHRMVIE